MSRKNCSKSRDRGIRLRRLARASDHWCADSRDPADKEGLNITPLHQAAYKGKLNLVKKLLQEGADPNAIDHYNWTPLHDAAINGHVKITRFLLNAGANPNAQDSEERYTPLLDAVVENHTKVAEILLKKKVDPTLVDKWNNTALKYAQDHKCKNKNCKNILKLLQAAMNMIENV